MVRGEGVVGRTWGVWQGIWMGWSRGRSGEEGDEMDGGRMV